MPELDGRIALITGASRGIGRATALELAAAGSANVVASSTGARRSAASAVSGLWKPPETLSLTARRAPASSAAVMKAATPSSVPLTTTCPGQL